MSHSQQHDIIAKLEAILASVPYTKEDHHLGRPFLTAYQIAIAFQSEHRDVAEKLGYPIGGAGSGVSYGLAEYVARLLSGYVKNNPDGSIEGAFLSNRYLDEMTFTHEGSLIANTSTVSMFRLR